MMLDSLEPTLEELTLEELIERRRAGDQRAQLDLLIRFRATIAKLVNRYPINERAEIEAECIATLLEESLVSSYPLRLAGAMKDALRRRRRIEAPHYMATIEPSASEELIERRSLSRALMRHLPASTISTALSTGTTRAEQKKRKRALETCRRVALSLV
jgi:hypothetical protein